MSDPKAGGSILEAGTVRVQMMGGVATIRFGHPKSNSLPRALLARLAEAITGAGADPDTRVIVLRSDGAGAFCAGASFDEFKAVTDVASGKRFFSGFAQVILAMIRCPQFVVTRVHGKTAGGGIGLVAASDYALATTDATLKLSEMAVGIGPFVVGPVIEKKIGLAAYSALAVDADWRSAEWAQTVGLYSEVLDTTPALDYRIEEFARKLAGYNPEAVRRLKEIFWAGTEDWDLLLESRAEISGTLVLSEYTKQAIAKT
ncbi:MAG TPA: enoyl-CoA hydratase/isomerase family protein [Gemmatimonadales bacterium]|nr:enoyl-CoA hydratase/isomerase family protein [Gemmatimonadales bacterium]